MYAQSTVKCNIIKENDIFVGIEDVNQAMTYRSNKAENSIINKVSDLYL